MSDSDFAALQQGHTELKAQVATLSGTVRVMRTELAANSEVTNEIRDVLLAAKTGFRVIGWIGRVFKWGGGIAAAIAGFVGLYHGLHK